MHVEGYSELSSKTISFFGKTTEFIKNNEEFKFICNYVLSRIPSSILKQLEKTRLYITNLLSNLSEKKNI